MRTAPRTLSTEGLPAQPFFQTPEQRAALARQRFFDEDVRPSGLVSEAVIQSWGRSRSLGHTRHKCPSLDPVSRASLNATLARNRELLDAAQLDLNQLEASLTGTQCRVLLTDATGVIVHVTHGAREPGQGTLNVASRVGVNLAEGHIGTTAPGIVVRTGLASTVLGCEHYYDMFQDMRCAAAPIRDVQGRLVGVLDLSTESRGFGFDAASVVGVFATSIENRLLQAQSDRHLVLHFQAAPALLGTPMEGLAGVSTDGEVVWLNATGHSLLGRGPKQPQGSVGELLGLEMRQLLALCGTPSARLVQLPSGLGIWMKVELRMPDGVDVPHGVGWSAAPAPVAPATSVPHERDAPAQHHEADEAAEANGVVPAPAAAAPTGAPSLAEAQQALIVRSLQANGGNVARTARQLGVSRGLVYRHLRKPATD
ncbi:GAF domain-containing protein [Hydrogenophaga sp. SL48]|uniref:GAF domain-containing protein n=1 Tax=Hydrogenophaga sp. SL48 TaxID=2806347 RepID=UPI001F279CF6|nr:helix-turn-helix domain-containing protein [Hydrogenophaga sp. SL48]UJW80353.1 Fis family transcriptional regulator [Hydrogenophaga sp. SL48]